MSSDMTRREQQDALDRTILEMLSKGNMCWTDLQKKVLATCFPWATGGRFHTRLCYLKKKGYCRVKVRGIYEITLKGKIYLEALTEG